ncbi:protein TRACHEARY ELEMENT DIFFERENTIATION-RELATED 7A-like [Actinidia eriantha]|uniref:protein TRACHEARY ELEMENT DIFFERENTIATION-RELATED 7A-like n=1 Tax=Actinidia eriantha TaxID=165200 RepID=UPI0025869610|nr:protein TRACHEARY ELEMENT DIFFERENTIATION-RELATED 7A-like [Actinidia eriantha]
MASPNNFDFPHFPPPPPPAAKPPSHSIPPPPPHHTIPPPPPHVVPPPPPSSPDSHSTVIVIVVVSFGGLFFLAFLAIALCCFIKKKKKKTVQETDIVHVDEHLKVKEAVVPGPHGTQAVVLSIEEDVRVEEERRKNEKVGEGMHAKSADDISSAFKGTSASGSIPKNNVEHNA